MKRKTMRKANSIFEYGILLSIITVAIVAMIPEVKRAIQGRTKDLSDYYLSDDSNNTELTGSIQTTATITSSPMSSSSSTGGNSGNTGSSSSSGRSGTQATATQNIEQIGDGKPRRDVVDYAKKPPTINYPSIEYWEWFKTWDLK